MLQPVALVEHNGKVNVDGRTSTNVLFADGALAEEYRN